MGSILARVVDYKSAVDRSMKDLEDGRIGSYDELREGIRNRYGL